MTVDTLTDALRLATTAGFVLLALLVVRRWLQTRDRSRRWLVASTSLLAVVALIGRFNAVAGSPSPILSDITVVGFVGSGYALLRLRDSFIRLSRPARILADIAAVVVSVVGVVFEFPSDGGPLSPSEAAVTFSLIGIWVVFVGEPVVRFWRLGSRLAPVQRARMRSMAGGYGLIVLILLVAAPATASGTNPTVTLTTQIVALVSIPLLYLAFEPPGWVRSAWRGPVEGDLGRAMADLLAYTDDRRVLAERALEWARRLIGADSAFLRTADGLLVVDALDEPRAAQLSATLVARAEPQALLDDGGYAIVLPLGGAGVMGVVSGAFTPLFGTDEVDRLVPFAASIGTALERVRIEEERQRYARELERANRDLARSNEDLERFAFIASHDLQEPLRMVTGYAQLLGRNYEGRLDPDADEFIGYVVEGVARMRQLLDDLLEFSRIGGHGSPMEPVAVEAVVVAATDMLRPAIEASGAQVTTAPLPVVHGDAAQLRLLFRHLLDNAIKFRSDRAPRIEVGALREGPDWVFRVSDDGIGIDQVFHDRVFVIFQRLHPRGEYAGTGVGLALCQRIVERHGGRIWVDSRPDAGSTFSFTIPAIEEGG